MDTPSPSCNKKTTSEQFFTPSLLKPGFLDLDFQQAFDEIFTWISRIEDLIQPEPQGGSGIGASAIQRRGDFFFLLLGNGRHVPPWDLQDLAISLDISWGVGLNTVEEIQHWFAMARNLKNNGITYQPQLVSGSQISGCHQQYWCTLPTNSHHFETPLQVEHDGSTGTSSASRFLAQKQGNISGFREQTALREIWFECTKKT